MQAVEIFMIMSTIIETRVLSGNITSFVISISFIWISGYLRLSRHFIHLYFFFPSTDCSGFLGSSGNILWYDLIFGTNRILIHSS
jgi:hypothetical protein